MSKTNLPAVSAAQAVITAEAASIALQATVDHAKLLGIAINVAITDSAGVMAGFYGCRVHFYIPLISPLIKPIPQQVLDFRLANG